MAAMKGKRGKLMLNTEQSPLMQSFELSGAGTLVYKGFEIKQSGISRLPDSKEDASSPMIGKNICAEDTYELGELGAGANGTVHKAIYLPELEIVALKAVNFYDQAKRHQMAKELTAFTKISNRYVIKCIGAFTDTNKGTLVMALEYMNRGSLKQIVQKYGQISENVLKLVTKQIIDGLRDLHKKGQVHRDIKPDNILANHIGTVKISDFGLARQVNDNELAKTFVGTMSYLSPERIRGEPYSYPADIWAVGLTLIYCATGSLPNSFGQNEFWKLLKETAEEAPPALDTTKFSEPLCDFVNKCLIKDPAGRATADELAAHPFLQGDLKSIEWPYSGRQQQDEQDMQRVVELLIEKIYSNGDFKGSLYDMARLQKIGDQLGFSVSEVKREFKAQFQHKFPESNFSKS